MAFEEGVRLWMAYWDHIKSQNGYILMTGELNGGLSDWWACTFGFDWLIGGF